jgi:hypothetical protein
MNNYNYYNNFDEYDLYSNSYFVNYNYNPHNSDIIESIDVLLEISDRDEYETEIDEFIEEAQRMSIETINLTQQIINGEIELEPINLTHQFINEQIRPMNEEIINSYLQNGDEFIETCSICLDDVVDVESTSKLSCGHHFHTSCIISCLQRNLRCPLCRQYCLIN